jgi:hypothetical protein
MGSSVAERRGADAFVPLRALTAPALTPEAALAEIRRLYFRTSAETIARDLAQAVGLLTRLEREEDRERATVYMEGLTEMRKEWAKGKGDGARKRKKTAAKKR